LKTNIGNLEKENDKIIEDKRVFEDEIKQLKQVKIKEFEIEILEKNSQINQLKGES
jgi:hypothetical protein